MIATSGVIQNLSPAAMTVVTLAWRRTNDWKPPPEGFPSCGFSDLPEATRQALQRLIKLGDKEFARYDAATQSDLLDFVGCAVVGDLPAAAQAMVRIALDAASAPVSLALRYEQLPTLARQNLKRFVMNSKDFEELPRDSQVALLDFITHDNQAALMSDADVGLILWHLVKQVGDLSTERIPLDEMFDLIGWVFADRAHDDRPLSFVSCARFVAQHVESPVAYCGRVDMDDLRDQLRHRVKQWLAARLQGYPDWIQAEIRRAPEWAARKLAADPQWLNRFQTTQQRQGDMFNGRLAA